MSASGPPVYVIVGPERHGVVRHARSTAEALHRLGEDVEAVRLPDAAALAAWADSRDDAGRPVHVDVTDALFGPTPAEAAHALTAALPATTTLTLHDVPQPTEGAGRFSRRAAAYARLADWAAGTVVSSHHEVALLRDVRRLAGGGGPAEGGTAVVPLPVEDRREDRRGEREADAGTGGMPEDLADDVVLLGFLYPGKGHAEALDALALLHRRGVDAPRRVTALGAVSAGHDDLVGELTARAAAAGLRFRVTGFVPDGQLDAAMRRAGIPVAAHHNVSASGSLAAWMSVGRRTVVPASRYTSEMDRLRPGTLHLVETGPAEDGGPAGRWVDGPSARSTSAVEALAEGIAAAASDPALTRLAPGTSLAPGPADCARELAAYWRQVHG